MATGSARRVCPRASAVRRRALRLRRASGSTRTRPFPRRGRRRARAVKGEPTARGTTARDGRRHPVGRTGHAQAPGSSGVGGSSSGRAPGRPRGPGARSGAASVGGAVGGRGLEDGFGVDDLVGVALLGQEPLAAGGELLVVGVAGDDGEEVGRPAVGLGPQDAPQPLRFLLAAAEGARDLDGHRRLGQVDGEVGHLGHDQHRLDRPAGRRRRASPARWWASCR